MVWNVASKIGKIFSEEKVFLDRMGKFIMIFIVVEAVKLGDIVNETVLNLLSKFEFSIFRMNFRIFGENGFCVEARRLGDRGNELNFNSQKF